MSKFSKHMVAKRSEEPVKGTHSRIFTPTDIRYEIEKIMAENLPSKSLSEIGYIGITCNSDFRIKIKMAKSTANTYMDVTDKKFTYDVLKPLEGLLFNDIKECTEELDSETCVINLNRQIAPIVISRFPPEDVISIKYNPIMLLEGAPYLIVVESTSDDIISTKAKIDFVEILKYFES
jgi:hypothetical protein